MSGSFWLERAVVGGAVAHGVRVEQSGGTITSVEHGVGVRDGDEPLHGLVLPGFANAHSHAFHRLLRGRTHHARGSFWVWRDLMYRAAARLDPDSYQRLASAVFSEMLLCGYTVVGEFHYLHRDPQGRSYANPNAMTDAVVAAAASAGIRLTLIDTVYLKGGIVDGVQVPVSGVQRRFSDLDVDGWARRHTLLRDGEGLRIAAAIHSVRAVEPSDLAGVRAAAGSQPLHAHLAEQPAELEQSLAAHGARPVALLERAGVLDERFTAVHATHVDAAEIGVLARSGATVCLCPSTERDLADGIAPAARMRDAGVPLAIGSDQNAIVDPFDELRQLEGHERLASLDRGAFTPAELLIAGTEAGYRSLGWDGGRLAVGSTCDLVSMRTDSVRTAGASDDQLWLAAGAGDVQDVVVGGRTVVRAGAHVLGDIGELLAKSFAEVMA